MVGGGARFGGDPNVTTLDFVNGMNFSGLNTKDFTMASDNSALFGARSYGDSGEFDFAAVSDCIPDRAESRSQQSSHAVISP